MSFQLQAQILDYCVLALLEQKDSYGYELTQKLMDVFSISESTLYPVLRRLRKSNDLTTYDQAFDGRNRRYYSLTPEGRKLLTEYHQDWKEYVMQIESIVGNKK